MANYGKHDLKFYSIGKLVLYQFKQNELFPYPVRALEYNETKDSLIIQFLFKDSQGVRCM